ncbi:hypothetical protein CHS0354_034846 [Potamilus streckersoni]|uniref:C2H2-type domain-containing protein n=1 Tax=Potamilus streckersoni TaxID=2493646 RepID=A0AAE0WE75_9BIVA|nr:hypothetical protein CHS0354_034846 [Potamilus streckersoni]
MPRTFLIRRSLEVPHSPDNPCNDCCSPGDGEMCCCTATEDNENTASAEVSNGDDKPAEETENNLIQTKKTTGDSAFQRESTTKLIQSSVRTLSSAPEISMSLANLAANAYSPPLHRQKYASDNYADNVMARPLVEEVLIEVKESPEIEKFPEVEESSSTDDIENNKITQILNRKRDIKITGSTLELSPETDGSEQNDNLSSDDVEQQRSSSAPNLLKTHKENTRSVLGESKACGDHNNLACSTSKSKQMTIPLLRGKENIPPTQFKIFRPYALPSDDTGRIRPESGCLVQHLKKEKILDSFHSDKRKETENFESITENGIASPELNMYPACHRKDSNYKNLSEETSQHQPSSNCIDSDQKSPSRNKSPVPESYVPKLEIREETFCEQQPSDVSFPRPSEIQQETEYFPEIMASRLNAVKETWAIHHFVMGNKLPVPERGKLALPSFQLFSGRPFLPQNEQSYSHTTSLSTFGTPDRLKAMPFNFNMLPQSNFNSSSPIPRTQSEHNQTPRQQRRQSEYEPISPETNSVVCRSNTLSHALSSQYNLNYTGLQGYGIYHTVGSLQKMQMDFGQSETFQNRLDQTNISLEDSCKDDVRSPPFLRDSFPRPLSAPVSSGLHAQSHVIAQVSESSQSSEPELSLTGNIFSQASHMSEADVENHKMRDSIVCGKITNEALKQIDRHKKLKLDSSSARKIQNSNEEKLRNDLSPICSERTLTNIRNKSSPLTSVLNMNMPRTPKISRLDSENQPNVAQLPLELMRESDQIVKHEARMTSFSRQPLGTSLLQNTAQQPDPVDPFSTMKTEKVPLAALLYMLKNQGSTNVELVNGGYGIKNPTFKPPKPSEVTTPNTDGSATNTNGKFICSFCKKEFALQRLLNRHLKCHSAAKRYLCTFCGKGFNDTFDLKRHTRIHTGVKPYTCPNCEKSFTQRCSLESHTKKVHGMEYKYAYKERRNKVYVCEDCGHSTEDPEDHYHHLQENHPHCPALMRSHDKRQFKFDMKKDVKSV